MAYPRRKNKFQGLGKVDVIFQDDSPTSTIFQVHEFPDVVPQGKSSFLVDGSNLLKPNVELKVEILDNEGETIYTEPVPNYLEGTARRVSMEVYSETAPGAATIHILGELDPAEYLNQTGQVIPEEFQGAYNVRWTRQFYVNTAIPNTFPILFYRQPQVRVFEILKGHQITPPEPIRTIESGSLSLLPTPAGQQEIPPSPDIDPEGGAGKLPTEKESDKLGKFFDKLENSFETKAFSTSKPSFRRRGRIQRRSSPEVKKAGGFTKVDDTTGLPKDDSLQFETKKVGGVVEINPPTGTHNLSRLIPVDKLPDSFPSELIKEVEEGGKTIRVLDDDKVEVPSTFTSNVVNVVNDHQFFLEDDFTIKDKSTGIEYIAPLDLTAPASGGEASIVSGSVVETQATMSYVEPINRIISATHFRSFADLRLSSMRTFSGDIFKIKVLARSQGSYGDFESIYEAPMEAPEVLVDTSLEGRFENIGFFHSQSIVDRFWTSGSAQTHVSRSNNFITDAIKISGSNAGARESNKFITQNNYTIDNENVGYTLRTKVFGTKAPKVQRSGNSKVEGQLRFKLSGSAFGGSTVDNQDVDYRWLGDLDFEDYPSSLQQDFGVVETEFVPDTTGSFKLEIEALSGEWHLGDVSITPNQETNFSPDFSRLIVPMPKQQIRPDFHDFIIEFYDINNNVAEMFAFTESVKFEGENIVIDSGDNLLSGSMFIGNSTGSGIEMAGVSSGFIRSIGYQGFASASAGEGTAGFMLYSGSVKVGPADSDGQGTESGDNYDGVGLELHDGASGSLRFRTDLGVFEVQTPSFFLGSNNQFVSGAEGNVEISSSNFHLTPEGNVTMSGTITATAGNIGNWQIIDGKLSGSNATLDADGAALYKTDQGPGSDQSTEAYLFPVRSNEYYIDFTPEGASPTSSGYFVKFGPRFAVDKDGVLFASGAVFEGSITASAGLIGGFQTDSSSFSSQQIFISGSPLQGGVDDPKYMFISTSNFNVKQDGSVTGSSILLGDQAGGNFLQFDGSTLTVQGNITADNISTPSAAPTPSASISAEGFASFVSASIAGFEVSTDEIKSSNESLRLKSGGQITGSNVLFSGGEIGGWTINSNNFASSGGGGIRLNSNGDNAEISINSHSFATNGIQLGFNGGSPRFYAGNGAQNFFKFTTSGGVDIKTLKFELDTTALELSSTQASMSLGTGGEALIRGNSNSPFISLQPSVALADKSYGEVGVFLGVAGGSTPLFSAVGSGGHFKFNGSSIDINTDTAVISGSNIQLATPTFLLGSVSDNNFISGSQGNMQIKSNNFVLDSDNFDVTADGRVTMSAAKISGSDVEITVDQFAIDSTFFDLTLDGRVTASAMKLSGSDVDINVSKFVLDSDNFDVSQEGNITGSQVLFTGGEIGGFQLNSNSISSSNGNLRLKSNGQITGSEVLLDGGEIGGFSLDATSISSSNNNLILRNSGQITGSNVLFDGGVIGGFGINDSALFDTSGQFFLSGSASGDQMFISSSNFNVKGSGKLTASAALISGSDVDINVSTFVLDSDNFDVTADGRVTMSAAQISGSDVEITVDALAIDSTNFDLTLDGRVTGSEVLFTGGEIGGFGISDSALSDISGAFYLSGSASGPPTVNGTQNNFISASDFVVSAQGKVTASAALISGSDVVISTDTFKLDTTSLGIDSNTARFDVISASGVQSDGRGVFVRIGEISDNTATDLFGMKIFDGTGTGSEDTLVKLGEEGNTIAGWTIANDTISSNNLVIHSSGRLETSDFASDVKGWRISSEGNGTAEFENIKVRGTLATAVFEKETVNAVGGQLYVANSTAITASAWSGSHVSASDTTMSVANVSGFTGSYYNDGEILALKKVSSTGFATEYVLVQSASRNFPDSDSDFSGDLYVTRGYGANDTFQDTSSFGDFANNSQSYEEGQVLVSTGRIGTGYVRINANPTDTTTPYIDIVERTGSSIYATELKVRLGDLSGLSSGLLYGNASPGFGLFTENVFLQGAITAQTGSFTGIVHIGQTGQEIKLGISASGGNDDGIHINDNNYWYSTGNFKVGSSTNFLQNSSGNITIVPDTFTVNTSDGSFRVSSSEQVIALGSTGLTSDGIFLSGSGEYNLQSGSSNFIRHTQADGLQIRNNQLKIDTVTLDMDTANGGTIALGGTAPTNLSSDGIFFSGSGEFNLQKDSNEYLRFTNSAGLELKAENLNINTSTFDVQTDAGGVLALGSSAAIDGDGIFMSGSGVFNLRQSSTEYLRNTGGSLEIKTTDLDLNAGNKLILSSSLNNGTIALGTNAHSMTSTTGTGFIVNGNGQFRVGEGTSGTNFLFYNGSGALQIQTENFGLATPTLQITGSSTQGRIAMGSTIPQNLSSNGILLSGSGEFNLQTDSSNFIRQSGGTFSLQSQNATISGSSVNIGAEDFDLQASTLRLQSAAGGKLALGGTLPTNLSSNGIFLSGSGEFNIQKDSDEYFRFTTTNGLDISVQNFNLKTTSQHISSSNGGVIAMGGTIPMNLQSNGIFISGSGEFNFQQDSNNLLKQSGGTFQIKSQNAVISGSSVTIGAETFNLNAGSGKLIIDSTTPSISLTHANAVLSVGNLDSVTDTSDGDTGLFATGGGGLLIKHDANNFLQLNSGFVIKASTFDLDATTLVMDSANGGLFKLGSSPSMTANGIFLSGSGEFNFQNGAKNFIRQSGGSFSLGSEIFSLDAGTMILSSSQSNGRIAMGSTPPSASNSGTGFYADGDGNFLAGNSSGNRIQHQNGTINLQSNTFSLDATTIIIDSATNNGKIALGASPNSNVAGTNAGIYMDGTGDFLARGNANNFIKKDGTALDIKAETFGLETNQMIISSSLNNGTISIGETPPSSMNNGVGFYANGDGEFFVGDGDGARIEFASDTNKFLVSASEFFMGGAGQFVSGSQGNIEISSSAFHLTPQGNVTASSILLGDKSGGNFLQFQGSTLTVQGSITADNISTPSAAPTPSASISADGFATFKSASIADFEILPGKIFNNDVSGTIGLVTSEHANVNVGSVASFYAGASSNTGQAAKISFGSDGRIRGAGAYVREKFGEEVEFLIAGTTTFGGGEDGDLMIQSNGSGGQLKVWKDGNGSSTPGQTINSGVAANIASVNYADTMMRKLATAGNVVELARDVYLRVVIFDVTQGDLYVNTNGFRFFASEGIFIYGTAVGDNKVVIRNNGGDGGNGSNGNNGGGDRAQGTAPGDFPAAAGGTGGAGGAAGAPGAGGTLAAPASGSAGGNGGQGADIKAGGSTGTGTPGVGTSASTPSAAQDGLSNSLPNISPLSPVGGAAGGAGGEDSSGTAAAGAGSGGSAVSNVQAGIQWLSTPVDSIIKFRAEFGTNDYPIRLIPSPSNVGGSGGSGGGGSTAEETAVVQNLSSFGGGGGGGGGGAGGNGGSVLICAKIIDFWKSASTYNRQANTMNIYNPGNNSQYGDLKIQADGGNGGRGGIGGAGGDNLI